PDAAQPHDPAAAPAEPAAVPGPPEALAIGPERGMGDSAAPSRKAVHPAGQKHPGKAHQKSRQGRNKK
ncbi:MAG: hypothetical protein M3237_20060, partial [Actinomycetota bacterium]|nr:hypothetical protein [Actinomycetota bacterium]